MWQSSLEAPAKVALPFTSRADPRLLHRRLACSPPHRLPLNLCLSRRNSSNGNFIGSNIRNRESNPTSNVVVDVELRVRDYEVDQYGVVNNAVYANYCHHAHHEVLANMDVIPDDVVRSGKGFALSELSFKFIAPLRSGDRFVDRAAMTAMTAARLYVHHSFYKLPGLEPILEAKATIVWLDGSYRPIRIPQELKSKLIHHGLKLLKPSPN